MNALAGKQKRTKQQQIASYNSTKYHELVLNLSRIIQYNLRERHYHELERVQKISINGLKGSSLHPYNQPILYLKTFCRGGANKDNAPKRKCHTEEELSNGIYLCLGEMSSVIHQHPAITPLSTHSIRPLFETIYIKICPVE